MSRSALVTGAGGFIGGHLATALVEAGDRVRAFVRYNSRSDRGALEWHDPDLVAAIEVVFGDLRDIESVTRAMAGVDVVYHLGAQVAIPYSYVNARDFVETNVLGTLNIAEAALRTGAGRVVHTSTSEVYGTAQSVPMAEDHPIEAQSPYAASKVGADMLMEAYFRSYQLPVTILRPFNTYGPLQSARAIVPTIITQALAGGTVRLGELDVRRDLTYVSDTVAGFLAAARSDDAVGRTVQLGTGQDVSVGDVVALVGDLLGRSLAVEFDPERLRPPDSEVRCLRSDHELARQLIGWRPAVDLRTGLDLTISWVAAHLDRFRVGEYVV
jgi:dTDP-glucose 4,6-dehydratase